MIEENKKEDLEEGEEESYINKMTEARIKNVEKFIEKKKKFFEEVNDG